MLSMLDSGAASAKRAYVSFMDFAVVPFFYSTWYDQTLFKDPNYFTYAYLVSVALTFTAKEISHRYKEANPHLTEDDHHAMVRFIDSFFAGLSAASELVFPAIIMDVIYGIKLLFSEHSLKIIHPSFLSICGSYGLYKSIEKHGFFAPKKEVLELMKSNGSRVSINSSEDMYTDYSNEEVIDIEPTDTAPETASAIESSPLITRGNT